MGTANRLPRMTSEPPLSPQGELARYVRLLIDAGFELHRAKDEFFFGQEIDQQVAVVFPVASRGQPADHVVLFGGGEGHEQQKFFAFFAGEFDDDIIRFHRLCAVVLAVDFIGDFPQVFLVVKHLHFLHVIFAIHRGLNAKEIDGIAHMGAQISRHGVN